MGPMSFENPLGYVIVIAVIIFAAVVLFVATRKKNTTDEVLSKDAETVESPVYTHTDTKIQSDTVGEKEVFYFRKKSGTATAIKIIPHFFPNGSALVITPDGNRQRKKMKHCFV